MTDSIAQSIPLIFSPGDVFEVRILDAGKPGRRLAGWFKCDENYNHSTAARIAEAVESSGVAYFTPQVVNPDLYKRCANVLTPVFKHNPTLTHDDDVTERRYLLIDVDPVRAPGHEKHCATDEEKAAGLDVADAVRGFFMRQRWYAPLMVDSGNGYHLYYRLHRPQCGGSVANPLFDELALLLRALAHKYDTTAAKIDTLVYNASRIMKIPGTIARKGPNTTDRPHRQSRIIEVPNGWATGNVG